MPHLVLVDHIGNLELFLFRLELVLLVHELLSQNSLLVVQVQEHAEVLRHLIVLLSLDDALDFSLLCHFLLDLVNLVDVLLE